MGQTVIAGFIRLRTRHLTRGVVGPVPVKPHNAPLDTPEHSDDPGVLADGIIHRVVPPVADSRDRGAEAARNCFGSPGAERNFTYPVEPQNLQVRIPETAFLLGKPVGDRTESGLAWRHHTVIAWSNQINALLEPAGGSSRTARPNCDPSSNRKGPKTPRPSNHEKLPPELRVTPA